MQRQAPVVRTQPVQAAASPRPKPKLAEKPKPAAKPARAVETGVAIRLPHDRSPVALGSFVVSGETLDSELLTAAGVALLLVALGSAVLVGVVRRQFLVASLAALVLFPGQAAAAPISYTLVGTSGANGWHTSNVTIRWVVDPTDLVSATSCPAAELISSEGTTTRQCTATFTWGTVVSPVVTIKIDKTAPTGVGGALTRGADSDGWYNQPVAASFSGQDAVSGIAGCSAPSYAGGDSASASLSGTCTDVAGNTSAAASVAFKYDATPPAVTPTTDRSPDNKGWYRSPLTVSFAGTDGTSGIAECSAPVRYAGPDLEKATVTGSCRDAAGNAAEAAHTFAYDATAPELTRVRAEVAKGIARLAWDRAADVVQIHIVRTPGVNGARSTIVYQGSGAAFVDRTVRPGVRYRYALSAADVAGNAATKTVTVLERIALYSPAATAVLRTPPLLRWHAVSGARFYNVQLYRSGKKILSTWPRAAKLQLARTWYYAGKKQQLAPGLYRWYVWAARGTRERPSYGRPLGSSTFRVRR